MSLTLHDALTRDLTQFEGDRLATSCGHQLLFQDHGADILAIAHLDWVGQEQPVAPRFKRKRGTDYVKHPALDDRLGVWALHFMRDAGMKFDLLLTDNEERGQSTARDFDAPRKYRWLFMFDRAGVDCVTYQYDSQRWHKALTPVFQTPGWGSYSCIADMEHLNVCGVNIGVGYYEHNGPRCWANLTHTYQQVGKFVEFYKRWRDTTFEYEPLVYTPDIIRRDRCWHCDRLLLGTETDRGVCRVCRTVYTRPDYGWCAMCGDDLVTPRESDMELCWGCYEYTGDADTTCAMCGVYLTEDETEDDNDLCINCTIAAYDKATDY